MLTVISQTTLVSTSIKAQSISGEHWNVEWTQSGFGIKRMKLFIRIKLYDELKTRKRKQAM